MAEFDRLQSHPRLPTSLPLLV